MYIEPSLSDISNWAAHWYQLARSGWEIGISESHLAYRYVCLNFYKVMGQAVVHCNPDEDSKRLQKKPSMTSKELKHSLLDTEMGQGTEWCAL